MAKLFPNMDPKTIRNHGERVLATALVSELPNEVEVYYGFNWLSEDNHYQTLREGEADFILLDPARGMLFVEVKGGDIEYSSEHGAWIRHCHNGRTERIQDPFAQVQRSMHEITNRVAALCGTKDLSFPHGYAVAFPGCRLHGGPPANANADIIWDVDKCRAPRRAVERVFDRWRQQGKRLLTPSELEAGHRVLRPRVQVREQAAYTVQRQDEQLLSLTDNQLAILTTLSVQKRAAIQGPAGSGKTLLARKKAMDLAAQGKRTLYLCYNKFLRKAVRADCQHPNLTVDTYHGFAHSVCREQRLPWNADGDAFWLNDAPELLMQAADRLDLDRKFDAIIVDEAQDFHDLWWASLDEVLREPSASYFYVFYDMNQVIYERPPAIPSDLPIYPLTVNCRNTKTIAEHCAAILSQKANGADLCPIGTRPETQKAATVGAAFELAKKQIHAWHNEGKLRLGQIVILAPSDIAKESPKWLGHVPLTSDFDAWRRNEGVLVCSARRFKGLEADAAFVIELAGTTTQLQYVARSRAKHFLHVATVR